MAYVGGLMIERIFRRAHSSLNSRGQSSKNSCKFTPLGSSQQRQKLVYSWMVTNEQIDNKFKGKTEKIWSGASMSLPINIWRCQMTAVNYPKESRE
jgi:hypothetical protein